MGSHFGVYLVCLVSALTIFQGIHGIQYQVVHFDCKGTVRFKNEIGDEAATSIMKKATEFVWEEVLEQSSPNQRKDVRQIDLIIDTNTMMKTDSSVFRSSEHNYTLYIRDAFITDCREGDLKSKITGLIYFEIASILQWAPRAERETMVRIAYYAILKANCQPKTTVHDGDGDKWDESTEVTARFLVYCNDRKSGFVAFLNRKMHETSFNEIYFQEFFKESLEDLWKNYKKKYSAKE